MTNIINDIEKINQELSFSLYSKVIYNKRTGDIQWKTPDLTPIKVNTLSLLTYENHCNKILLKPRAYQEEVDVVWEHLQ